MLFAATTRKSVTGEVFGFWALAFEKTKPFIQRLTQRCCGLRRIISSGTKQLRLCTKDQKPKPKDLYKIKL